jgi:predicted transcriptional regulator
MDYLAEYAEVGKYLEGLFRSRLKVQILLSLHDGPRTLAELREVTGSSSGALIPKIRPLEALDLVKQDGYSYRLTPLGCEASRQIRHLILYAGAINRNAGFWLSHDMEQLPAQFLAKLHMLYHSQAINYAPDNITGGFGTFVETLNDATEVYGLYPVMSHLHADVIEERAAGGVGFEIIISDGIAEFLLTGRYQERIKNLQQAHDICVYRTHEPLAFALTVTDSSLLLNMYTKGTRLFDCNTVLIGSDPVALEWGADLLKFYRSNAVEIDFTV